MTVSEYNHKVVYTTKNMLKDIPVTDGFIIFCRDEQAVYFDFDKTRQRYDKFNLLDTEDERTSTIGVNDNFYFCKDTKSLWYFSFGWYRITLKETDIIDTTLTISGKAADAKVVGDELISIKAYTEQQISDHNHSITDIEEVSVSNVFSTFYEGAVRSSGEYAYIESDEWLLEISDKNVYVIVNDEEYSSVCTYSNGKCTIVLGNDYTIYQNISDEYPIIEPTVSGGVYDIEIMTVEKSALIPDEHISENIARKTYVDTQISGKANTSHNHSITNITNLQSELNNKVPTSRTINGKTLNQNITITANDIGADPAGSAESALETAKEYVRTTIETTVDDLNTTIGSKAEAVDLTSHTGNTTVHTNATERSNWNKAYTHSQATHARTDATKVADSSTNGNILINDQEVNVYTHPSHTAKSAGLYKITVDGSGHVSNTTAVTKSDITALGIPSSDTTYNTGTESTAGIVKLYNTTGTDTDGTMTQSAIKSALDGKSDSGHTHSSYVNQNAFSNVKVGDTVISADTTTDTLTLVAGSNVTITPDSTNDKITISATDTTYSAVTQSANGLMSSTDKTKLDGIAEGANKYTLPVATSSALGGVKSGGDISIATDGTVTINDDSHNHTISNIDNLQSTLDGKAASSHGTHVSFSTTAPVMDGTASVGTASSVARSDHKHPTDTSRAAASHTHDDRYYTETEVDTKLAEKANSSHGTHVSFSDTAPKAAGTASVGTAGTVSRSDHVHPLQTTISGNAGSATKVNNNLAIKLNGGTTEGTDLFTFNGSSAKTINITPSSIGASASGHTHSSYVNQNAFSNVKVGDTTVAADTTTDTLTLVAGSNVTITPDSTNDKITISATDTVYTHPSYTARTGVPSANASPGFGGTFTVSQPVSDATGHITAINSRTITIPSTLVSDSTNGLMSSTDKKKLDGINLPTITTSDNGKYLQVVNGSWSVGGLIDHTHNIDEILNLQTTLDGKSDSGHTHSSYVNQNAFSNVKVGSTTIAADTATDTLTLVAGSNITLTPDATNDQVTIAATDTVYTHPTTSGNKHIPSGGSSGQILRWSSDGTAVWGADNNTTYTANNGVTLSGTTFSNSGVRSIATGSANGTISVNTNGTSADVAVKGLGTAAYTASTAYAPASHSHSYLPLGGGSMTGVINSSVSSGSYLAANQGTVIINSTAAAGAFAMLAKLNTTNGYITFGAHGTGLRLNYTAKTTVSAGTNSATKSILLFNESGESSFLKVKTDNMEPSTSGGVLNINGKTACYSRNDTILRQPVVTCPDTSSWDGKHISRFWMNAANNPRIHTENMTAGTFVNLNVTVTSSDIRLKENIKDCDIYALDTINSIKMHEFDFIDPSITDGSNHRKVGLIADELELLDDNLVNGGGYDEDGSMNVKSIDALYLMNYIIKAEQELYDIIQEQSKNITKIEKESNGKLKVFHCTFTSGATSIELNDLEISEIPEALILTPQAPVVIYYDYDLSLETGKIELKAFNMNNESVNTEIKFTLFMNN